MTPKIMFVLRSKYDQFTHRTGNIGTLKDLIFTLSGDEAKTKRIVGIAKKMQIGDAFATDGVMLTCEREEDYHR